MFYLKYNDVCLPVQPYFIHDNIPFREKGVRVVASEERGWGERNCRHAHEGEGVREREHPSWLWGCTYVPTSFCVLRNAAPQITTLQQSFRMTGRGDARLWLLILLLNICCFSCYLYCSVLLFFTDISDGVAASADLHTLIWLMWVFMTQTQARQIIISHPSPLI